MTRIVCRIPLLLVLLATELAAQQPPYDVFPPAEPPYYRVRYEASAQPGELVYPVNYTIWMPRNVERLRGVIVHQHGCGEGSCKSGLTGAYDLHWQALAKQHDCALLAPSYEQPDQAECQMWCDPRNGSGAAFQKCLVDLGEQSGHPELATVPWALWGHSGGGHWAGGMVLLHPQRVAAAWLRSGVPLFEPNPQRPAIKPHTLPAAALQVPVMCNPGTQEGVTVKVGRFANVWPANEAFFYKLRGEGGLIGVAVDPLTAHECGNQRYLAIAWLDACLRARLPQVSGDPLEPMPTDHAWLAPVAGFEAVPAAKFEGDPLKAVWLPNESIAQAWMEYVKDTKMMDTTPPPAPTNLRVQGNELNWEAEADLESGLAGFVIERDGQFLANVPEQGKNPFGRPIFQNLQYSDTPTQPLVPMQFTDTKAEPGKEHAYRVIAVNTVGLKSRPTPDSVAGEDAESTSLFNGKDLTGWHVDVPYLDEHPDAQATFIVRDGKLVSLGQPQGHLITDAKYENYRLEVEYRFAGKPGNCGVLVHASEPRALYKMFPKSIEVQMNHQHAGDFWCIVEDITVPDMVKRRGPKETWGITEGKARRILNLTDDSEKPVGQWNTMVIECVADAVKVWVNGDLINHGSQCTATKGQIALQAEGSEVEFRKLSLTPITELTN